MRAKVFTALIAVMHANGVASPFRGENSQLAAPPASAGDEIVRAEIARIHPRRKDLPKAYTGCQTTWIQARGGWIVTSVAYFEGGELASLWFAPPDDMLCEYRSGKAMGPRADKCPTAAKLPAASMAPGCAEKILGRGGTAGCQSD